MIPTGSATSRAASPANTACFTATFDHFAQNADDLGGVFETLIVHAFLRVVDVCDGLFR